MAYTEKEFTGGINEADYPSGDTAEPYKSELIKNYFIEFFNDSFIIVKCSVYSYYGRHAHGDSGTRYFIIDTAEKRILEISDLILPLPDDFLKRTVEAGYTIDNYLRQNIWPVDAVTFRAGSVGMIWNVYTIAPYIYGTIDVEIPYGDIERYLTEKGKKLKQAVTETAKGGSVGTTAVFGLNGNATTGFIWEVSMDGEGLFDLERRSFGSYSQSVGAPVAEELILKAAKAGTVNISFVYERPWEGGERLVEYVYVFKIHDDLRVELLGTDKTIFPGVDEETLPSMPELKAR